MNLPKRGEDVDAGWTELGRLVSDLVRTKDKEITNVFQGQTSGQRVLAWEALLAGLDPGVRGVDATGLWYFFAYRPAAVAAGLALGQRPGQQWSTLVELYEAWYRLAFAKSVPGISDRDAAIGSGYLARTRWLLLSAPYRPCHSTAIGRNALARVELRIERARQARDDWLAVLETIEDYPTLLADIDVEDEAVDLAVREIGAAGSDAARTAINGYVATRLLLPRFSWIKTLKTVHAVAGTWTWLFCGPIAFLFAAALALYGLGAAGSWRPAPYTMAAALALAGYGLIGVSACQQGALAWPWLLRQPASAAVGLLALAAIAPEWWSSPGSHAAALWASLLLFAAGAGYLTIEAANHGVRGLALCRPAIIGLAGFGHAILITLIGLRWIVPVFAQRAAPVPLSCWWHVRGCQVRALAPWQIVLVAAAWSFAAGVFLQILWDDQPITAPLAHVRWTRRG